MQRFIPEACQIVVRTDSEIETLDDLLGKTISIGAEESGTERNANQILQAQGISGDMVKTVNLDYTEAAAKLADGEIDAFFCTAGTQTTVIGELAKECGIRLLSIDVKCRNRFKGGISVLFRIYDSGRHLYRSDRRGKNTVCTGGASGR